ncbi:Gmad2 immunoglobulin-like domain-containing protein [Paenibacillus sp. SC116]|uniref:Gmad2 immunoglobulin-like domain-containing protein n=1 Tax=Paenibacillus sp. SC116 TaxID=2968986 RepID=UPI00215A817A|nr:Gmad2 immunoglobulin-like domain-containing protein [Paenibacillus sp. SC116]MCR8845233.1 Gmad2 immunoglobulin-like domain-containing protein [Paenibacillus sp. SC116]
MKTKTIAIITASILAGSSLLGYVGTTWAGKQQQPSTQTKQEVKVPNVLVQKPQQEKTYSNDAFRNIGEVKLSEQYVIKGQARVFEGNYNYVVKQGSKIVAEGFGTASKGGPEWGAFSQTITVPVSKLNSTQPLTVELFEIDMESGKQVNKVVVALNGKGKVKYSDAFRGVKVASSTAQVAVKGEARVHEGTYNYAVKQGGKVIAQGFSTASIGAPEWGQVKQTISIPKSKVFGKEALTLELFEVDMESGKAVNKLIMPIAKEAQSHKEVQKPKQDKVVKNDAFRNMSEVKLSEQYVIKGEGRLFEGNYNYVVKQGSKVIAKGFGTASKGGPEWGTFAQTITVPVSKTSKQQPLTVELFEMDMESGKQVNKVVVDLNGKGKVKQNDAFRGVKVVSAKLQAAVKGEARVFEGTYNYTVKQGKTTVAQGYGTASVGAPQWGKLAQTISIDKSKVSGKQPLTLELFEVDMESGKATNKLILPIR